MNVAFNCTHPSGVENCPIHSKNPEAPLMDCRYNAPMILTESGDIKIDYPNPKIKTS